MSAVFASILTAYPAVFALWLPLATLGRFAVLHALAVLWMGILVTGAMVLLVGWPVDAVAAVRLAVVYVGLTLVGVYIATGVTIALLHCSRHEVCRVG